MEMISGGRGCAGVGSSFAQFTGVRIAGSEGEISQSCGEHREGRSLTKADQKFATAAI